MLRRLLKSKIHGATVTDASVDYEGSITVDCELMEAADLVEFESVSVWDLTNGERIETYVIAGESGSGRVEMNGAAAMRVKKGHKVIIASFAEYDEDELEDYSPRKVFVDAQNGIITDNLVSAEDGIYGNLN